MLCALLLLFAACGQAADPVPEGQPAPTITTPITTPPGSGTPVMVAPREPPPPIRVRGGGTETVLRLWSSCWQSGSARTCADGRPPAVPPDIGSAPDVEVAFDAVGWRFSATFVATGQECGREQTFPLTATGPTTHRLMAVGRAGDYTVTLHGRSAEGATNKGDVATTFRWHTTEDGPNEAPSATISLLATPADARVSMGAELSARALGVTTEAGTVEASAVVTSSTGASMRVDFRTIAMDCVPEGSLFLRSDGDDGRAVAALGPAPLRYEVTLALKGRAYRGTGVWPQDEIKDCSPCTRLRFDPPLPAL